MKLKRKNERGITIVGLIIIIAIIAFVVILLKWAVGFSDVVKEKTKKHQEIDFMQSTTTGKVNY